MQDGLTGSAWGDWANYIASPWAPAGSQQLAAGITDKWGGLCPANDACVIDSFALQWFTSRHLRNRFMHALNGNSCLFAWALAFCIFLSWYFMDPLLALVTLCWSFFWFRRVWHLHTKPRFLKPYRFVGRARHAAARVRHSHASWKVRLLLLFLVCSWTALSHVSPTAETDFLSCDRAVHPVTRKLLVHSPFCWLPHASWNSPWVPSRKLRKNRQHAVNGNVGQVNKCKWESSVDLPGIELAHPGELTLPPECMIQFLRSDQVSDNTTGVSFAMDSWSSPSCAFAAISIWRLFCQGG